MNNQTIDGLRRDLLARAVMRPRHESFAADLIERGRAQEELRALLDAPACSACNDTGRMHEPGCEPGACTACLEKPAAQLQGEHTAVGFLERMLKGSADDRLEAWQGEMAMLLEHVAEQPAPLAVAPLKEDRDSLIAYGRSCGLDEASTLCSRLAYAAYYPPGTRFKAFTPKTQKALGDLLIKAANEIASLPGGPYERFKARQAKKAEPAKT